MTMDDAVKTLLDLFPDMEWGEDNDGQVVIYTGMRIENNQVVPMQDEGGAE